MPAPYTSIRGMNDQRGIPGLNPGDSAKKHVFKTSRFF